MFSDHGPQQPSFQVFRARFLFFFFPNFSGLTLSSAVRDSLVMSWQTCLPP